MRLLIDACVLYPTVMREVVLGCAQQGLFEPNWSARILDEWMHAAAKLGPSQAVFAQGETAQIKAQFPRAMVGADPGLEARLWLPDANDVHVLASAIKGSCDGIMTLNNKDFPGNLLADEGLFRVSPDLFLLGLLEEAPDPVLLVAARVLGQANQMAPSPFSMRGLMKKARLPRFGKALERIDI